MPDHLYLPLVLQKLNFREYIRVFVVELSGGLVNLQNGASIL